MGGPTARSNSHGTGGDHGKMPIVRVEMLKGRSKEQKAKLAEVITKAMVDIANAKPEATSIVFYDVERSDWAEAGKLVSDT
jgi:4-oxalocrotonate tautomerase